jgi:glycosyltransferase 2 family protein
MTGAGAPPSPRAHDSGPRGWWMLGLKVALSLGLMTFLVMRIPIHEVRAAILGARKEWLLAALGLMLASNVLGAWQWQRLLRAASIEIPFWKVCAYYHVGLFFNNFLPANIGGDIARVLDASRYGPSRGTAAATVLMDRLVGTVALAGLALVTTIPAIDRFHLSVAYAAVVVFFVLSVGLVWAVFHPGSFPRIERWLSSLGLSRLNPHVDDFAARLRDFGGRRSMFLGLLMIALVVQVARVGVHVLVARSLGLSVPVTYFFLFVPLLAVIVSLPISLNGIGLREGAGVMLFGLVGVGRAPAFSLQITTYLVAVAVSLIGGLVVVGRIPRRKIQAASFRRST